MFWRKGGSLLLLDDGGGGELGGNGDTGVVFGEVDGNKGSSFLLVEIRKVDGGGGELGGKGVPGVFLGEVDGDGVSSFLFEETGIFKAGLGEVGAGCTYGAVVIFRTLEITCFGGSINRGGLTLRYTIASQLDAAGA